MITIGRNGKGKTTFLHLLLGKYEYTGSILTNVVFDYFPYKVASEDLDKNADDLMDMASREIVKRYLAGKKSFILVSHDRDFLDACIGAKTKKMQSRVKTFENRIGREIEEKEGFLTSARTHRISKEASGNMRFGTALIIRCSSLF